MSVSADEPPERPRCRCGMAFDDQWPCCFAREEWRGAFLPRPLHQGCGPCPVCTVPDGSPHHIGCPYDRCPGHLTYRLSCRCRAVWVQTPISLWRVG